MELYNVPRNSRIKVVTKDKVAWTEVEIIKDYVK